MILCLFFEVLEGLAVVIDSAVMTLAAYPGIGMLKYRGCLQSVITWDTTIYSIHTGVAEMVTDFLFSSFVLKGLSHLPSVSTIMH